MHRLVVVLFVLAACAPSESSAPEAEAPDAALVAGVEAASTADALMLAMGDAAPPAEMIPPMAAAPTGSAPVLRPLGELLPVQWSPVLPLTDIFPSYVLAYVGRPPEFAGVTPPRGLFDARYGDRDGLLGVRVDGVRPGQLVRVDVAETRLSDASTFTYTALHPTVELYPEVGWRADALRRHTSASSLPVTIGVWVDGAPVGQRTYTVRVRSVNESPRFLTANGKTTDLQDLFVGYVDETSPVVATVRREALDSELTDSFAGYQTGAAGVEAQALALWHALQRRGVRYSSIADAQIPTAGVLSQIVRRPAESLATAEANCIDGTVLMASLLLSVGIDPFIVVAPGHAYLGYYTAPADGSGSRTARFLEMTMVDRADLRDVPRRRPRTLNPLAVAQAEGRSRQTFDQASAVALESWREHREGAARGDRRYRILDVADVRGRGLIPIGEAR